MVKQFSRARVKHTDAMLGNFMSLIGKMFTILMDECRKVVNVQPHQSPIVAARCSTATAPVI